MAQIEDAGEDVEALLAPRQHQPVTLPLDKQYRGGERFEAKAEPLNGGLQAVLGQRVGLLHPLPIRPQPLHAALLGDRAGPGSGPRPQPDLAGQAVLGPAVAELESGPHGAGALVDHLLVPWSSARVLTERA